MHAYFRRSIAKDNKTQNKIRIVLRGSSQRWRCRWPLHWLDLNSAERNPQVGLTSDSESQHVCLHSNLCCVCLRVSCLCQFVSVDLACSASDRWSFCNVGVYLFLCLYPCLPLRSLLCLFLYQQTPFFESLFGLNVAYKALSWMNRGNKYGITYLTYVAAFSDLLACLSVCLPITCPFTRFNLYMYVTATRHIWLYLICLPYSK